MNTATDIPYQLLTQYARSIADSALWLADESFPADITPLLGKTNESNWSVLSNRFNVIEIAKKHLTQCYFNDFDFSVLKEPLPQNILYRVSKEKALTHYLINRSYSILPLNGKLTISGFKNDGIKTYIEKAGKLFGTVDTRKGDKQSTIATFTKTTDTSELLDDKDYETIRDIDTLDGLPVYSKPGVFGWNKKDPGSVFLTQNLTSFLNTTNALKGNTLQTGILDLGCGYGYISLYACQQAPALKRAFFTLTDNNAAAIQCASTNIKAHGIKGEVIADDCASQIKKQFDIILCNPPFHKGFDVSGDITTAFLQSINHHLDSEGKALVVVNQFVGLEKRAQSLFSGISELARNKSFKLITLSQPK